MHIQKQPTQKVKAKPVDQRTMGVILMAMGAFVVLSWMIPGFSSLVWALMMGAAAAIFGMAYLRDRRQWFVLLIAFVLAFVAGFILLERGVEASPFLGEGVLIGYFLLGMSAPFYFGYARNRRAWFWLLVALMFSVPGVIVLASGAWQIVPVLLILAGGWLIMREIDRKRQPRPAPITPDEAVALPPGPEYGPQQPEYGPHMDR